MTNIENIITQIKGGKLSKEGLINLHRNALKYKEIPEEDREEITALIEKKLREDFPRAANKIFGAKDFEARELLSKIYSDSKNEFNLSNNKHKNGVKTGGNVISGEAYLYTYISFKGAEKIGAHLALSQPTINDELKVIVCKNRTGKDSDTLEEYEFGIDELPKAALIYKGYLDQIIN